MKFDFNVILVQLPWLLKGAELTLSVSLLGIFFGTLVGVALALALQSAIPLLVYFVRVYISFIRGTPLFIQILIVFFILPSIGIDISRFTSGVVALSLNSGAYISEMIRGGLTSIRRGQIEAGRALGMPRSLIWRRIILPQVFTVILPPLTVEFASLLKYSALLSVIGVVELTRTAQQIIAATFKPIEIWLTVGILYFIMCFALGVLTRRIERATTLYRLN
jgi:His/Glu/Gln/Arg/opine family amino acid ABC transporter permease subunit